MLVSSHIFASALCAIYQRFGLVKYDPNGHQLWAIGFGEDSFSPEVKGITVGSDNAIYLSGNLRGCSSGGFVYHTTKVTGDGEIVWDLCCLITGCEEGETAVAIGSDDSVYLTGRIFKSPSVAYRTYKISNMGSNMWNADYAGSIAGYHKANGVGGDAANNLYVTGLSPALATGNDFATIQYDQDGHQLWMQRYDGPAHGDDVATAMAVSPSGEVYVTGWSTTYSNLIELTTIKYAELQNIQLQTNNTVLLQFFGAPGQAYRFQATTNFPNWQNIGSSIAGSDGIYSFQDTNAPAYPYRFYRTVTP